MSPLKRNLIWKANFKKIIIIIIIVLFKMIFILEPKGACLAFKKDRTHKPFF
jgi:hypothetical protein